MGRKKKSATPDSSTNSASWPLHFDIDYVRSAASRQWPQILSAVGGIDSSVLDSKHHPCPKCGGTDRFRLIDADAGAVLCNKCAASGIGDGFASLQWITSKKFSEVLALVADYLGIEPTNNNTHWQSNGHSSNSRDNADPSEHLTFHPWDESAEALAALWCLTKPPITITAIRAVGGQLARYRKQYTVLAIPVHGEARFQPGGENSKPVGWCLYNITGGNLPTWPGKNQTEWVKVKSTRGSKPGVIADLTALLSPSSTEIWKPEGPSDLLAFLSLADRPANITALTNNNGAKERPPGWVPQLFTDKSAYTIHDADQPGQDGALGWTDERTGQRRVGWAPAIANEATTCRNVQLPYPIVPDHGPDLRDYINASHTFADLQALAASSPTIQPEELPNDGPQAPLEADDDPHRLARVNLASYASQRRGGTLRFWRDEWYTWRHSRGCYRKIAERELRAKLTASIREEFVRLWAINMDRYESRCKAGTIDDEEAPPQVQKVTKTLVTNVMDAMASMVVISSSIDQMTWISDAGRERRAYVSMQNGILDLEKALADEDENCIADHSPNWFSSICLPYAFSSDAECPKWDAFLERNLEMDPERIKILQEWAGYLLLPDTGEQKFLVLEGEGSNGKSVYCAAITAMLGADNCSHIPLELFADRFAKTQTLGKLVNISADVGELDKVAEGYLKSFTSGDVMYFDRKGVPGVDCTPSARMMLACNNRPRFSDRSSGVWRRMLLIPWRIEIGRGERIRNMDKPWWWEQSGELPGIFNWALIGLHRLRQQSGFTDSSLSTEALEDYRLESNPARAFLKENLESHDSSHPDAVVKGVKSSFMYKLYCLWAKENGYRPMGEKLLGKEVKRVFPNSERMRGGSRDARFWFYKNLRFIQEEIGGEKTFDGELF